MSSRGKSRRWLQRQNSDVYVKQARAQGYRSRAAFKLMELDDKYHLLKPGMSVLDLGGAPGGWSQVAMERVGSTGTVVAVDLLPIEPIDGVTVIQGDMLDDALYDKLMDDYPQGFDLVISDMAPNLTGIAATDQARAMNLAEIALQLASERLKLRGHFLIKLFQGRGFDSYIQLTRGLFEKVSICKPKSSRAESHEVYCFAKGYTKSKN